MTIHVRRGDPHEPAAIALVQRLWQELCELYGDFTSQPYRPEDVSSSGSVFVVAWREQQPLGCGAIAPLAPGVAEIKRVFVAPHARRQGVAASILAELEQQARQLGYGAVRLVAGVRQPQALRLYEASGYHITPCFGEFAGDPMSVCYEKRLAQPEAAPWEQPGWREQVTAWIDAALAGRGAGREGAIEQPHVRPWSTVLRVPTGQGAFYFKATAAALRHEVALTQALRRWAPACTPPVAAADPQRGWLLFPDGGPRLRETLKLDRDLRHWQALLRLYAGLQIDLADHSAELLAMGVPDRGLAVFPVQYEGLLADVHALDGGHADALTAAESARLWALRPHVAADCQTLAAYGLPATVHHGDLHDGNVFFEDGRYVLFDWGDCSISHPFFSLRTVFVSIENSLQIPEGDAAFDDLADVYLQAWAAGGATAPHASAGDLRAAFKLAQQLSPISSALIWRHALASLPAAQRQEYGYVLPSLLREFLDGLGETALL